jgi:pimeloyl-ACP methyl ester carboxylesterase
VANYTQLGDVCTYYEEDGQGEPLVLLHPGGADSRVFESNVPGLAQRFKVFRPDRRGHGRTADVEGPISYELMARDTIAFLEQVVGGPAFLVGHSDGAPVALVAALLRPDLVRRLVVASGVFHHEGWAPGAIYLDEESMAFFVDFHGAVSPDGPNAFPALNTKLDRMHEEEPALTGADLAGYTGPSLVMVGDDEDEIPIEHTLAFRAGLSGSQLAIVPGTGHGLLMEKPDLCNRIIIGFLAEPADEAAGGR